MYVPYVVESKGNKDRVWDIWSRLNKDRIIFLGDPINHTTANVVIAQMLYLESEDCSEDIHLYLNSPGGTVTDGLAIYSTMQYIKSDVSTVCIGQAASMASVLLSGGAKGKRYILPYSRVMLHRIRGGVQGVDLDMEIQLNEAKRLGEYLTDILVENTGQDRDKLLKDMDRDYFMSPEESVEYGIVDAILK